MRWMILVIGIALFSSAHARAAGSTTRPTAPIDPSSCVTAECHANIKTSKVLHGPVSSNTCESCHETIDAQKHTYRILRAGADLCTYCHEFNVSAMPVQHKPVKEGQCLGCHDPHGGATRSITRENTMAELCGRCHESVTRDHKFNHTPVMKGQCDSCHPPHAAMFPKLLDATGSDLCLACHTKFEESLSSAKFRHKAMDDGCLKCHDAHGSNQPMQIAKAPEQLCLGCHDKTKATIRSVAFKHSPMSDERSCLNCHTSHGGNTVKLMLDQPATLCMKCHKDPIKTANNRVIPAASELNDSAMHKHGAIKDGQCSGCHAAHGANQPILLTKAYSTTIYQAFSVESYELCFSCHDPKLVQSEKVETATGFRNGDRNLHWVHVKEGQRGRACAVCHTTHASVNAKNIRDTALFKVWNMPIRFSKTQTGGTCSPGCHVPWAYDRTNPVKGPTTGPARNKPPTVVHGESEQPMNISLNATGARGERIQIPDSSDPSVLIVLNQAQVRDEKLVKSITASIPDGEKVQVIAILTGPSSNGDPPLPWPTILDLDGKVVEQLGVRGWPTALVLQSDGLQIAKVGGSAESFILKLAPYIALAGKSIDHKDAEDTILKSQLITDGASSIPSRNLQLARQCLDSGKPQQAYELLVEAFKADPTSTPLQAAMIRTLAELNRPGDALGMLNRIKPDQLPAGDHDLLRARILIAMKRAPDATTLVSEILKIHPEHSEAHRLLGRVYEQQGDFKNAATQYRLANP